MLWCFWSTKESVQHVHGDIFHLHGSSKAPYLRTGFHGGIKALGAHSLSCFTASFTSNSLSPIRNHWKDFLKHLHHAQDGRGCLSAGHLYFWSIICYLSHSSGQAIQALSTSSSPVRTVLTSEVSTVTAHGRGRRGKQPSHNNKPQPHQLLLKNRAQKDKAHLLRPKLYRLLFQHQPCCFQQEAQTRLLLPTGTSVWRGGEL